MQRILPTSTCFLLAATLLLCVKHQAHAQSAFQIGPSAGYELIARHSLLLGVDARIAIPGPSLALNPAMNVGFFQTNFPNGETLDRGYWKLGLNVSYEIDAGKITPYLGPGLAFAAYDLGNERLRRNDFSLNALGGVRFEMSSFRPFIQAKYGIISSPRFFAVKGGLLFSL